MHLRCEELGVNRIEMINACLSVIDQGVHKVRSVCECARCVDVVIFMQSKMKCYRLVIAYISTLQPLNPSP